MCWSWSEPWITFTCSYSTAVTPANQIRVNYYNMFIIAFEKVLQIIPMTALQVDNLIATSIQK